MKRYIKSTVQPIEDEPLKTRLALAEDFTAGRRDLEYLAENDPEGVVRRAAKSTLRHIDDVPKFNNLRESYIIQSLEGFSKSSDPRIRWQIAQHPDIPVDVLQKLAEDDDGRVRQAANKTLQERRV